VSFAPEVEQRLRTEAVEVIARYPQARSALLPLLHLVQSEEGYVSPRGIELCADILDLSTAEVSGVATFYTQYKRHPNGEYTVGVCTNTLCAIMGGDQIFDELSDHLGVGHDETTEDGKITLERVECNAACDFAPVLMVNWEFFDNQTPGTARQLVDDIQAGKTVVPTRGASSVADFKQVSRVLAGFDDHRADEGVGAAGATLEGLTLAKREGWQVDGLYDGKSSSSNGSGSSGASGSSSRSSEPSGGDRPPVEQIAADHVADPDAPSAHDAGSPAQEGRAPATPAARPPRKRTTKKKDS
jgi:NADH-quinone oxidoreductase subunit E